MLFPLPLVGLELYQMGYTQGQKKLKNGNDA